MSFLFPTYNFLWGGICHSLTRFLFGVGSFISFSSLFFTAAGRWTKSVLVREEEGTQGKREDGSLNLSLPRNPCLSRLNDAAGGREKTNKNCRRWLSRGSLNSARKPRDSQGASLENRKKIKRSKNYHNALHFLKSWAILCIGLMQTKKKTELKGAIFLKNPFTLE